MIADGIFNSLVFDISVWFGRKLTNVYKISLQSLHTGTCSIITDSWRRNQSHYDPQVVDL